jgi:hypothetical protein
MKAHLPENKNKFVDSIEKKIKMSNLSKKFVSAALSTVTAVTMSGVLAFTPVANAQTADAQAQIAALLAQIAQLQSQLGGSTSGSVSCTFTRSLTVGSRGTDVTCLQNALIAGGFLAAGNNTGYFGGLTKAAVVKWQISRGVSPASGFFGPLSRAAFAAQGNNNGGGNTGGNTGGTVPGSGLGVSMASDSAMGSVISGAGQISVGSWNLTASNSGAVTVTGLTFNKLGVVSDNQISNMYLADSNGAVIAQYSSLSAGVATFSGLNLTVGAGQSMKVTLRIDMSSGASAGNTLAFALASVQTAGNVAVTGLPSAGNTLTITTVQNPNLATATWDFNAVGGTVDAGTNNVQIATANVNVGNSPVWMKSVKFTIVGSANLADLKNLKLMVNGTQVGTTLAMASSDGSVVISLGSGVKLNTGNNTVDLYADVSGSPNRNFTVRVLRPYDVYFVDSQYNSGLTATVTDDSTTITINQGQITVQLASDTPTGNIPVGASNVTLAKFTIFASGEAVKVNYLDLVITETGSGAAWSAAADVNADITNIKIVDDAGNQVGSTISTVVGGLGNGECTLAAASITCHFGTSSSNINYIVPANTTRVLSAKVDIKTTNDATSLRAALAQGSNNLQGQMSFQLASSGAASGAVLTVVNSPLTAALNGSFAAPTYVAGANNVKVGSFVLSASSADGAKVNTLTFDKDASATTTIQNLKVMVGSSQCGSTKATVGSTETSMAFSCSPALTVSAGGSVTVDVYADILGSTATGTASSLIDLIGWSAVGATSNSSITFGTAVSGQNIVISSGPTLTIAADGSTPSAKQIVMGTSGNTLLSVLLTANNVEDVKVTQLAVLDTISGTTAAGQSSFSGLTLWEGSTQIGGTLVPSIAGTTTSTATFSFATPLVIPKNGSKVLTVKGDVSDFSSGAVSGSVHTFSVASTTVVAYGKDSNSAATLTGSASGNAQSVYRTKLSFTASVIGSTSGRVRTAVDDLATITWTNANSGTQLVLNSVVLKFQGQAVSAGSTAFTVDLLKSDGSAFGGSSPTCTPGAGNSCSVTFNPSFTISGGQSQATKLRVNSASFYDAASQNESLSVTINATGDVSWNDGTTTPIGLEASMVPFTIASVQY